MEGLQATGTDVLCEQHDSRITDFRRGQSLGRRDHVVCWPKPKPKPKPKIRPDWMSWAEYAAFPDGITVRKVKVSGRILVTTLLDHRKVPKAELSQLYGRRWNVERDLQNIKTALGMDVLSCLTPQRVRKKCGSTCSLAVA